MISHLILVTTVRKTRWAPQGDNGVLSSPSGNEGIPKGNFPYLPKQPELVDRTLIDGILVGTIIGQRFEIGVTQLRLSETMFPIALQNHLAIALAPQKDRYTLSLGTLLIQQYRCI
jgi:hypothetical protein